MIISKIKLFVFIIFFYFGNIAISFSQEIPDKVNLLLQDSLLRNHYGVLHAEISYFSTGTNQYIDCQDTNKYYYQKSLMANPNIDLRTKNRIAYYSSLGAKSYNTFGIKVVIHSPKKKIITTHFYPGSIVKVSQDGNVYAEVDYQFIFNNLFRHVLRHMKNKDKELGSRVQKSIDEVGK
jgi:hypothetical protein